MNHIELNEEQRNKMRGSLNSKIEMEWDDPDFMDLLLGGLPRLRRYSYDDKTIMRSIGKLENCLLEYNACTTNKEAFLKKVSAEISEVQLAVQTKGKSWHGLSIYEIENAIKLHKFCLISGEGGIGKSYFISRFEEHLAVKNIPHLCLYGKFEKSINRIDFDNIMKIGKEGFVFVVDAINEMTEDGQRNLLVALAKLKEIPEIRIIVTCRTGSMDDMLFEDYRNLSEFEYRFRGVSFESALAELLKRQIPDVYKYEDILYSNNALLLSMLCDVLTDSKIIDETENGIAAVTFILERYVIKSIEKRYGSNQKEKGRAVWLDVKKVALWMYQNDRKSIDENSLVSVVKTEGFLDAMVQMGLMNGYQDEEETRYLFVMDSLTDFLIARSLFDDINGKSYEEQVSIVISKREKLYSLDEPLIITIFEKNKDDYVKTYRFLKDTDLLEKFSCDTIVKIPFRPENIENFKNAFRLRTPGIAIKTLGGYADKPYNCSNYLFDYYSENNSHISELSNYLEGYRTQSQIKGRLKNILYYITLNNKPDRRDDEAFYFSVLCCAAPNNDVRCLAVKLLFEMVSRNIKFMEKAISCYEKNGDYYIRESIIYVLSQQAKGNHTIIKFFDGLIENADYLTAKSVRRIAAYKGDEYSFIGWNRNNLYSYREKAQVSEFLNDVLMRVSLIIKDFLPFRYWGKDHIDMPFSFLINDRNSIAGINRYLSEQYACVREGDCNGSAAFEKAVLSEIETIAQPKLMDKMSLMESLEERLIQVFNFYGVPLDKEGYSIQGENFQNSVYFKCIDIAIGQMYGSLMCNYYTNQFATYNNSQNSIGYEVYDPLEYGEEMNLGAPVPTHHDFVEKMGDCVLNILEISDTHDVFWARNIEETRANVLHILERIKLKNHEWMLLGGRIDISEEDSKNWIWRETYDIWCCTSASETLCGDGEERTLTIELDKYSGALDDYKENDLKPWLCKEVDCINKNSDVFDNTVLVLPPSEIVRFFDLELNTSDISWETENKEKVIFCNNNKYSYYKTHIGQTMFIRKDYLDRFKENHTIKYFAYSERFVPETGYAEETAIHYEIEEGVIKKEIPNYDDPKQKREIKGSACEKCIHDNIMEYKKAVYEQSMEQVKRLIEEFGYSVVDNEN